jgi:excisionase family DNA binding protein
MRGIRDETQCDQRVKAQVAYYALGRVLEWEVVALVPSEPSYSIHVPRHRPCGEKAIRRTNPMFTENEVLTVREAAAYLKMSTRTVMRRIAERKLAAFKVLGDNLRIRRADLELAVCEEPVAKTQAPGGGRGRPKISAAKEVADHHAPKDRFVENSDGVKS